MYIVQSCMYMHDCTCVLYAACTCTVHVFCFKYSHLCIYIHPTLTEATSSRLD